MILLSHLLHWTKAILFFDHRATRANSQISYRKQAWKPGSLNAFGMQSNYVKKVLFWLHLISRANFYKNTSLNTFAFLSKTLQNYTFGHICYSEKSLQKFIFEHICCSEQTGAKTIFARLYSPCKKVQWWRFDQIYNFRKSTCKILVLTSCLLSLQMSQKIPCYPYFYSQQQI